MGTLLLGPDNNRRLGIGPQHFDQGSIALVEIVIAVGSEHSEFTNRAGATTFAGDMLCLRFVHGI